MREGPPENDPSLKWSQLSASRREALLTVRLARRTVPYPIRHTVGVWLSKWRTYHSPARIYQRRVILPLIARRGGTALLVGVREYNAFEPPFLEKRGVLCWTLDFDPAAVQWGAAGRHVTAPIEQAPAKFDAAMFDTIMLSGVFGFGLNDSATQEAALEACAYLLKPRGLFVLGWNTDLVADPSSLHGLKHYFEAFGETDIPGRVTFRRSTHVFDFYGRNSRAAVAANKRTGTSM